MLFASAKNSIHHRFWSGISFLCIPLLLSFWRNFPNIFRDYRLTVRQFFLVPQLTTLGKSSMSTNWMGPEISTKLMAPNYSSNMVYRRRMPDLLAVMDDGNKLMI